MFAHENFDIKPDIMTCAKAIASGFPLSAVIGKKEIMKNWPAGAHGGTFGGNPVSCAASLATIEQLENGAIENGVESGAYLKKRLFELKEKYPIIGDVRGIGLMLAMEFVGENNVPNGRAVKNIINYSVEHGLILLNCGTYKNVLRFIAPTTVSKSEIDEALVIIEEAIVKEC